MDLSLLVFQVCAHIPLVLFIARDVIRSIRDYDTIPVTFPTFGLPQDAK